MTTELERMRAVHRKRRLWSQVVDEAIQARQQYGRGQGQDWIDTPVNRGDYKGIDNRKDMMDVKPSYRSAPLPPEDKRTQLTVNGVTYGTSKQMAPVLKKTLSRYFPDVNGKNTFHHQSVFVRFQQMEPGVLGYHQWRTRGDTTKTNQTLVAIGPGEGGETQKETVVHELVHLMRHKQKRNYLERHEVAKRPEESETVAETGVRLGRPHLDTRHSSNYYGVHDIDPYPKTRIFDRGLVLGKNNLFNSQRSLKTLPNKFKQIDERNPKTNLYKGWEHGGRMSGLFTTSEGEVYNFSLKRPVDPYKLAKFVDRQDGWTGEENVYVYNNKKRRLILSKLPRTKWKRLTK